MQNKSQDKFHKGYNSKRAISPLDGRYHNKVFELNNYFGEHAYMKYRLIVEIEYLLSLLDVPLVGEDVDISSLIKLNVKENIRNISKTFDFDRIKEIEKTTNHDVKAVEYYLRETLETKFQFGPNLTKFIHFAVTSHDINSCANAMRIKGAIENVVVSEIKKIEAKLDVLSKDWVDVPMLAKTHGQIATPTILGKEIRVFVERLQNATTVLQNIPHKAKFGGAIGNLNAHYTTHPNVDWLTFCEKFVSKLGLDKNNYTTQVEHYDTLGRMFDELARINTILIDCSRDMWMYISMGYLKQKVVKTEVGSSTMPHKINPINFENCEGNALLANALLKFLSGQIPVSRLQRDLVNSTLFRNVGVAFGHSLVALKSFYQGLQRIDVNTELITKELDAHYEVLAEPVQNILKIEANDTNAYEKLKDLCRSNKSLSREKYTTFVQNLHISAETKEKLLELTPSKYTGKFKSYVYI